MEKQLWLPFEKFPAKENHCRYIEVDNLSNYGLDADDAANLGMRIVVLLRQARFHQAIKIIAAVELEVVGESELVKVYEPLLESPIAESSLPQRIINMLDSQGLRTWGDVAYYQTNWFEENISHWGPKCSQDLQLALRREIAKRQRAIRDSIA